jgi:hypothetical protein
MLVRQAGLEDPSWPPAPGWACHRIATAGRSPLPGPIRSWVCDHEHGRVVACSRDGRACHNRPFSVLMRPAPQADPRDFERPREDRRPV